MEIEAEIEKACQEEDYDRAGVYVCAALAQVALISSGVFWLFFS